MQCEVWEWEDVGGCVKCGSGRMWEDVCNGQSRYKHLLFLLPHLLAPDYIVFYTPNDVKLRVDLSLVPRLPPTEKRGGAWV